MDLELAMEGHKVLEMSSGVQGEGAVDKMLRFDENARELPFEERWQEFRALDLSKQAQFVRPLLLVTLTLQFPPECVISFTWVNRTAQ